MGHAAGSQLGQAGLCARLALELRSSQARRLESGPELAFDIVDDPPGQPFPWGPGRGNGPISGEKQGARPVSPDEAGGETTRKAPAAEMGAQHEIGIGRSVGR